jgi:hypothetical protein
MAVFQPNALISEIRGKLGNYVFSRNLGGAYIREIGTYTDTGSAEQLAIREFLNKAVQFWQHMNDDCKLAWTQAAKDWNQKINHFISGTHVGYNYFISSFIRKCINDGFPFNNLLANPHFTSSSNWILSGNFTISGGTLNKSVSSSGVAYNSNTLNQYNQYYFLQLEIISLSAGSFNIYFIDDITVKFVNCSTVGIHNGFRFYANLNYNTLSLNASASAVGSVDNACFMLANQYPCDLL